MWSADTVLLACDGSEVSAGNGRDQPFKKPAKSKRDPLRPTSASSDEKRVFLDAATFLALDAIFLPFFDNFLKYAEFVVHT